MTHEEFSDAYARMCESMSNCYDCDLAPGVCSYYGTNNPDNCRRYVLAKPQDAQWRLQVWLDKKKAEIAANKCIVSNRILYDSLFTEKPWQEHAEACGHFKGAKICFESVPCADCDWWNQPAKGSE